LGYREKHLKISPVAKKSYDSEGERLQVLLLELRAEARLRQKDLDKKLGHSQTFVSKYELGERQLNLPELDHICEAVGISLNELGRKYKAALKKDLPPDYRKRRRVDRKAN
jgi:transcriptional regulator with XRE-family HTH domain